MTGMRQTLKPGGFTFIELLIVLMILGLMATVTLPSFNKLAKSTRVREATDAVLAALQRASVEQQVIRAGSYGQANNNAAIATAIVVFFGEDPAAPLAVKPKPGTLPPYGQIEVWTAGYDQSTCFTTNSVGAEFNVYWSGVKQRPLTLQPITFSDGIRIVTGLYYAPNKPTLTFPVIFSFGCCYTGDSNPSKFEIFRHEIALGGNNIPGGSANAVLIFDKYTGQNQVVVVRPISGPSIARMRPYVAPKPIGGICYVWPNPYKNPATGALWPADLKPGGLPFQKPMDLVTAVNQFFTAP